MTVSEPDALIRSAPYSHAARPAGHASRPRSHPRRRAALPGGAEALHGIGVRLAQVTDELAALVLDAARRVEPQRAVDLALAGGEGAPRLAGEARRERVDGGVELGSRHAAQREAERRSLRAAHDAARVDQLAR